MRKAEIEQLIDQRVKEEVERYIIQKCSTEVKPGEVVVFCIEVGDMPKEQIFNFMERVKKIFENKGLERFVLIPTQNGKGVCTIKVVKEAELDDSNIETR